MIPNRKRFSILLMPLFLMMFAPLQAGEPFAVLELFTSQG